VRARPDRSALETLGARFRAAHGRAAEVAARVDGQFACISREEPEPVRLSRAAPPPEGFGA
jgi:hypothetical protein